MQSTGSELNVGPFVALVMLEFSDAMRKLQTCGSWSHRCTCSGVCFKNSLLAKAISVENLGGIQGGKVCHHCPSVSETPCIGEAHRTRGAKDNFDKSEQ